MVNGPSLRDCGRARTFDKKTFGRCRQALSDFVLRAYLKPTRQAEGKPMTDATKQKFLVLFLIPASVMADWAKTDPTIRQAEEQKMQAAWGKWMGAHAKMIISTEPGGKSKRATASGGSDTKKAINLCSF